MTTNNIWKVGKVISAGEGANEFVSLIRNPKSSATTTPTDDYAAATQPSHVISEGDRARRNNPLIASNNPLPRTRNSNS